MRVRRTPLRNLLGSGWRSAALHNQIVRYMRDGMVLPMVVTDAEIVARLRQGQVKGLWPLCELRVDSRCVIVMNGPRRDVVRRCDTIAS